MSAEMPLVVEQINQRLDGIERRQERQDQTLARIDRRISGWAGALTAISGMAGTAVGVAIAYVRTHWPS